MWETLLTYSPLLLPSTTEAVTKCLKLYFLDGMFSFERLRVRRDMCGWFVETFNSEGRRYCRMPKQLGDLAGCQCVAMRTRQQAAMHSLTTTSLTVRGQSLTQCRNQRPLQLDVQGSFRDSRQHPRKAMRTPKATYVDVRQSSRRWESCEIILELAKGTVFVEGRMGLTIG